ncbi:hypothetical protein Rleg9DRAFT_1673 [Rhizobium leguminosarum bv. trifolii WSM597]|uniref:Uncharacterized protein n=1 Tax=Rhizobium leguminosarum bv. trifolii WSM597 TaxID=754764 RepID=I9N4Q1_RHILT|nr:hypothetical protein [Rhizobium leguminosarum]EJB02859.1 hypothetical protein Rleg9DRAFT_1673 [Rhizobium leguminosarum bv. trifolii WSM597]
MLANFEEILIAIPDPGSKSHFSEAVRCYESGALRAAIVSAYIALCFDLVAKLKSMAELGDGKAKQEYGKIENFNEQVRAGNQEVIKNILEFERGLIELFHRDFEFLDNHEYTELVRLRDDRNRCAHPTFLDTGGAYVPSPELARLHIRNAGLFVLAQPPKHGRAAIQSLKSLITSQFFPSDEALAIERLKGSEIANARTPLINGMVDEITFGWPDPSHEFHHQFSAMTALGALTHLHRAPALSRIRENVLKLLKRTDGDSVHLGAYLAVRFPDIGNSVDSVSLATLSAWLMQLNDEYTSNLVSLALQISGLRAQALAKVSSLTAAQMQRQFLPPPPEVLARAVALYCECPNWTDANAVARICAIPLAQFMSPEQIDDIFRAASGGGSDLKGSHELPNFLYELYAKNPIDNGKLDELIAKYELTTYRNIALSRIASLFVDGQSPPAQ